MNGSEFMEKTRYAAMQTPDQERGLPQPPLQQPYDHDCELVELPSPEDFPELPPLDFLALVELRASVRDYLKQPMNLLELSFLLWCTQGVKMVLGDKATKRTVPSAGARHAFETYLLINNVEGLAPGLYRFLAVEHKLLPVAAAKDCKERILQACLGQRFIGESAVVFFWSAAAYRMTWRYGERGYRYLHIDAGHVGQNLYLAAQAIGYGTCAFAAFDDECLNEALFLDGKQEFVVYGAAVGKV